MITDIYPHKAFYLEQEPVNLLVESNGNRSAEIVITHLGEQVRTLNVSCSAGETLINLGFFPVGGYEVTCCNSLSAFDVCLPGKEPFRFGFLSCFSPNERRDHKDLKQLLKYHTTAVQFYDWMYRHHHLIAEEKEYTDAMGRRISGETVREKIRQCHSYGMKALAYGAVYAADEPYILEHPDQMLYKSTGEDFNLIDFIKIMNIRDGSSWCDHIIGEFRQAVRDMDFDGIHMDQYGYPKSAISASGEVIYPEEEFLPLINRCTAELEEEKEEIWNTFNAVNNWPIEDVATARVKSLYIEVWKPFVTYNHLRRLIREARLMNRDQEVTLAAYIKPYAGDYREELKEATLLLTTAVITACGGRHLVLGEESGLLSDPYYVNYSRYSPGFARVLRNYNDFYVKYGELLFNRNLREGTDTYLSVTGKDESFADNCSGQVIFSGAPFSVDLDGDHIGILFLRNRNVKIVHLINLLGNDNLWNEIKAVPPVWENCIKGIINADEQISGVYFASPDYMSGKLIPMEWKIVSLEHGKAVEFTVPYLQYWSMVVIETF